MILIFLTVAQYARKETVRGYLTPTAGTAKIFIPRQGTISAVHVKEGEIVRQGQSLLTIATAQIAADGEDVDAVILDTLTHQRDLLRQQIAAQEERTASERERLSALMRGIEDELAQLESQIALQGERIQLSEELARSAAALSARGHMPETEYRQRQEALIQQRQNLAFLRQRAAEQKSRLTETRYSLEQLPAVMAERIQALRNDLAQAEQRIAEINGRRAYVIKAPSAGRVSTLQATVGRAADPRYLQLEIVPANNVLEAELFVPTRAIGFVRPGQDVRVLYDAFPYQSFGAYHGQIVRVSQTILKESDISAPVTLQEPAYKVTVALDRQDIDADGQRVPLQADMLLRADIVLGKRTLMSWLIDPLISARR
ncbi:HlyD family efflux transporter periplasmic adaptor subunit [Azospirillum sp. sgz302134]